MRWFNHVTVAGSIAAVICSRLMLRPLRRVSRISDARSETISIATTACGNSSSMLA